jgi:hypothetical protein
LAETGQPYVFTNDNPLNATDPLGQLTASMMAGGYETPKQEAADLNQLFQEQREKGQAIGHGVVAGVVDVGGHNVVIVTVIPENIMDPGTVSMIVLGNETKNVKYNAPSATPVSVCQAVFGIGGMGLATAGGDVVTGVLASPETDGLSLAMAGYGVILFAGGVYSFLVGSGTASGVCYG